MIPSTLDEFWVDVDTSEIGHVLLIEIFSCFGFGEKIIVIWIKFVQCCIGNVIHLAKLSGVLGTMLKDSVFIINPAKKTRNNLFDILEKVKDIYYKWWVDL